MFGQPRYHNYPANFSYNPYLTSPYNRPSPFDADMQDRARALAEQRARRAQYLPDEVDDDDDNLEYTQFGPRERAYLEAKRRQEVLERMQQQEMAERQRQEAVERQRSMDERRRQQDALEQRLRQVEEARQKLLVERRNQIRLRREEEARAAAAEREKQFHRSRSNSPGHAPPSARHEDTSIPINVRQRSSQPATAEPQPAPSPPVPRPTTPKHTIEEQNVAASRIQKRYRIHASSRALDNVASQFEDLKKGFVYPLVIDFQKPGSEEGHIRVPACRPPSDFNDKDDGEPMRIDGQEGKLAYTSTNFAVNQYTDALEKLLIKLDGVESWGQKSLRLKRRNFVRDIEKEVSRLERYCKQAWIDYREKETQQ